ncbi:MAG: T9SS type A sorting domain-containing protein [Candidatus Eisenbacteria bacterium]
MSTSPGAFVDEFAIEHDASDGLYLAWIEQRGEGRRLLCRHLDSPGSLSGAWPQHGLLLCDSLLTPRRLRLISDEGGGAYIVWVTSPLHSTDPGAVSWRAQHVLSGGTVDPAWPSTGVTLRSPAGPLAALGETAVAADGKGALVAAWGILTNGIAKLFVSRIGTNGLSGPGWGPNGNAVAPAAGPQDQVLLAGDGLGGLYVAWSGAESLGGPRHFRLQHRLSTGGVAPGWSADGDLPFSSDAVSDAVLAADGYGGAYVACMEITGASPDVYLQHATFASPIDPGWPPTGRSITFAAGVEQPLGLVSDREGGVIVAWAAGACPGCSVDLLAERRLADGTIPIGWGSGVLLAGAVSRPIRASVASDAAGGALLCWSIPDPDEVPRGRAQRVLMDGRAGGTVAVEGSLPTDSKLRARPNPSRVGFTMDFVLPAPAPVQLWIVDLAGRMVWSRSADCEAGPARWFWDGRNSLGVRVPAGSYFARLSTPGGQSGLRLIVP